MKVIKLTFTIIAVFMAVTLILTANNSAPVGPPAPSSPAAKPARMSRFLQEKEKNPRAADHCRKDNDVCNYSLEGGRNATCCNNKCIDLQYDNNNCGKCKNKCDFTDTCCRGECVDNAFDKRHCGGCNHKCMEKGYCIFGMCDYA